MRLNLLKNRFQFTL